MPEFVKPFAKRFSCKRHISLPRITSVGHLFNSVNEQKTKQNEKSQKTSCILPFFMLYYMGIGKAQPSRYPTAYMHNASFRRDIEVVITALTRNQVYTRVYRGFESLSLRQKISVLTDRDFFIPCESNGLQGYALIYRHLNCTHNSTQKAFFGMPFFRWRNNMLPFSLFFTFFDIFAAL